MRTALVLALVLTACNPGPVPSSAPSYFHPYFAINRTVLLRSGGTVCGGVAISDHEIATAAHCVPTDLVFWATKYEPFWWRGGLVAEKDTAADLAIVTTSHTLPEWAAFDDVARGETVYSIHHGGGREYSLYTGRVEDEPRISRADWIQTDVPIEPGASGCGLWNREDKLTGITSWYHGSASYFVPTFEITRLLNAD